MLGENAGAPLELQDLQAECQLRTILEEAWGEIDHKYRYVRSRIGVTLPDYIQRGFYNLSVYLQIAALQAEDLCLLAETYTSDRNAKVKKKQVPLVVDGPDTIDIGGTQALRKPLAQVLEMHLEEVSGFRITPRTLAYIEKRFEEVGFSEKPHRLLKKVFTEDRILEFKAIFREVLNRMPFTNEKERNIDVINAINFAIFNELQGKRVAQEGLRSVLKWRKDRSKC
jgi:hypothetical protein